MISIAKTSSIRGILAALLAATALHSVHGLEIAPQLTPEQFAKARQPLTNIVFFDLPVPRTGIDAIYIYHEFPDRVATTVGEVPLGGNLHLFAVQAELALSDRLALVASKDGYIVFEPDGPLFSDAEGFADIALGPKFTFYLDEEDGLAAAGKLILEIPTGADRVWQGNGNGTISPSVTAMKFIEELQILGMMGFTIPFDMDEESTFFMQSYHFSYSLLEDRIFPLIEFNHFYVVDGGAGNANFLPQVGGAVPAVAEFEGSDLVNFGASEADGTHYATVAFGARGRIINGLDIGIAYELPLVDEEETLLESRLTLDIDFSF